jgi:hypothetical protein
MPGNYTVKLTVNGQTYTQPLVVKMDPRVKTPIIQLQQQHDLSYAAYKGRQQVLQTQDSITNLRKQIKERLAQANEALKPILQNADKQLVRLEIAPAGGEDFSFSSLNRSFSSIYNILHDTDMPPTTQAIAAAKEAQTGFNQLNAKWKMWKEKDLIALNAQLKQAGLGIISL